MLEYYDDLIFNIVMRLRLTSMNKRFFRPESYSLEFLRQGRIKFTRNKHTELLSAPVIFWMSPGDHISFDNMDSSMPFEHLYCDYVGARAVRITESLDKLFPSGFVRPQDSEAVYSLFLDLIKYHYSDRVMYHTDMAVCVEKLLLEMERSLRMKNDSREDPYKIEKTAEEIRQNPFQTFNFAAAARRAGITLSHFRRVFKNRTGKPPAEYVHEQCMIRAADMLENPNIRIKDVLITCQYNSFKDFSRAFKRYSGLSPRAYRQRLES